MNSTKAEEEMKGRGEREEQRESRSSRVLQQTTIGKHGRRPTKSRRSTNVCCKQLSSIKFKISNQKSNTKMMMVIPIWIEAYLLRGRNDAGEWRWKKKKEKRVK